MKKETLHKLITESKPLLKTATPQQRVKLLKLIREGINNYKKQIQKNSKVTADYLDEK